MTLPLPFPVLDANASAQGGFGALPEWDLSDLYAAPDAPELARDMGWLDRWSTGFRERVKDEGIDLGVTRIGVNTGNCIVSAQVMGIQAHYLV